jgi:hypothetical protein
MLTSLMGDVAAMVVALQSFGDSNAWSAVDACIAFWMSLRNQRDAVAKTSRPVKTVVVSHNTPLDSFARQYKNSVAEIMALNASALRGPYAPKGTALSYYLSS